MQRIITSTALVFAGALLLSGCATSGGTEASASADSCEVVRVEVRDVSNGAQNAILTVSDPAELQAYLDDLSERVDALDEQAADDSALADALDAFDEKIDAASDWAETLPSAAEIEAGAEIDAEAQAAQTADIQAAAVKVTEVCTAE
ncbi:hypothetical protein BJY17_002785 [Agromyces hippuratus]|uniref:Uncharacterized protein n=1 Tax=Agromyces hippuratus TaxID=286438 RepID=A0A852WWU2_9MICO|nr:hypothetical protein [Agromyces hippuratus]NYG22038.1 hypothetical protein [Agromyces hippuratus]